MTSGVAKFARHILYYYLVNGFFESLKGLNGCNLEKYFKKYILKVFQFFPPFSTDRPLAYP
jgi:hypothetical protein